MADGQVAGTATVGDEGFIGIDVLFEGRRRRPLGKRQRRRQPVRPLGRVKLEDFSTLARKLAITACVAACEHSDPSIARRIFITVTVIEGRPCHRVGNFFASARKTALSLPGRRRQFVTWICVNGGVFKPRSKAVRPIYRARPSGVGQEA